MKKFLSFLTSVLLALAVFPLHSFALTEPVSEYDEMLTIACEAFPEYASKIQEKCLDSSGRSASNSQSVGLNAINVYETRQLDANTQVAYQEDLEGNVFIILASSDPTYSPSYTITDSATGTGYSYREITIEVSAVGHSQVFRVDKVQFTYVQGGSCEIGNTGTFENATTKNCTVYSEKLTGNNSSPAYVNYRTDFVGLRQTLDAIITLNVTPSGFSISANPY